MGDACESLCNQGVLSAGRDQCTCSSCYVGEFCDSECSEHGSCAGGACVCALVAGNAWRGAKCDIRACPGATVDCSGHGACNAALHLWKGDACTTADCEGEPDCYGRGTCTAAQASEPPRCTGCAVGYMGTGCELPCTHGAQAPMDSGFCQCLPCFTGGGCQTECTGHGHCAETWRGAYCEVQSCPGSPVDCSGHGECNAALQLCVCEGGWSGAGCSLPDCGGQPDCSGRGTCNGVLYDPPICVNCVASMGPACELLCVHGVETPAFSGICACESCCSQH